jgi:DNA topoisomerase-1
VNASLPEGKGADDVTLKEAIELLEAKAATKKTTKRKTSTTKSTSKAKSSTKSASTKPAARKAPATTKTGRLRASAVRVIRPGDA